MSSETTIQMYPFDAFDIAFILRVSIDLFNNFNYSRAVII